MRKSRRLKTLRALAAERAVPSPLARTASQLKGPRRQPVAAAVARIKLQLLETPARKRAKAEVVVAELAGLRLHAMLQTRPRAKKRPKAIARTVEAEEEATVAAEVKVVAAVVKAEVAVVADHRKIVTKTKTAGSTSSITWSVLSTRKSTLMKKRKFRIFQHQKTVLKSLRKMTLTEPWQTRTALSRKPATVKTNSLSRS